MPLDIAHSQTSLWGAYYLRFLNEVGEEALVSAVQEAGLSTADLSVKSAKLTLLPTASLVRTSALTWSFLLCGFLSVVLCQHRTDSVPPLLGSY